MSTSHLLHVIKTVVKTSNESVVSINADSNEKLNEPDCSLRRSSRSNKGVPPPRYGINFFSEIF